MDSIKIEKIGFITLLLLTIFLFFTELLGFRFFKNVSNALLFNLSVTISIMLFLKTSTQKRRLKNRYLLFLSLAALAGVLLTIYTGDMLSKEGQLQKLAPPLSTLVVIACFLGNLQISLKFKQKPKKEL